jgi:hypothetical protein
MHNHAKMRSYICSPADASFSPVMTGLPSIIQGLFALASQLQATKTELDGGERSRDLQRHAQKLHGHGS